MNLWVHHDEATCEAIISTAVELKFVFTTCPSKVDEERMTIVV